VKTVNQHKALFMDVVYCTFLYGAGIEKIAWMDNVLVFWVILMFITAVLILLTQLKDDPDEVPEHSNKWWVRYHMLTDMLQITFVVAMGWYWIASAHIFGLVVILGVRELQKERREAAETRSNLTGQVEESGSGMVRASNTTNVNASYERFQEERARAQPGSVQEITETIRLPDGSRHVVRRSGTSTNAKEPASEPDIMMDQARRIKLGRRNDGDT